ncbi:MAG: hypothetical protein VW647_04815, partial [Alphaproteobacteria bacterium]
IAPSEFSQMIKNRRTNNAATDHNHTSRGLHFVTHRSAPKNGFELESLLAGPSRDSCSSNFQLIAIKLPRKNDETFPDRDG